MRHGTTIRETFDLMDNNNTTYLGFLGEGMIQAAVIPW